MALSISDLQFAINDARERHKATVDLIRGIDTQAVSFISLLITLASAALSGAGAILLSTVAPVYPRALGLGLLGFSVPLILGAACCLATLWPAVINLQGRDPDFWQWADHAQVKSEDAYRAYLENLKVKAAQNAALNTKLSNRMLTAKIFIIAAPIIGAATAIVAMRMA